MALALAAIAARGALKSVGEGATETPRFKPINLGIKARKRKIPKNRKARVRLRAHLEGRELDRPLTAHERSWL